MARQGRWSRAFTSFSQGLISEAAADNLSNQHREAGLVQALNVQLLRDGGLRTRAPFVRVPGPALGRLTHIPIESWTLRNIALRSESPEATRLVAGSPPDYGPMRVAPDGVLRFDPPLDFWTEAGALNFLEVAFTASQKPRWLCFHDVRLLTGTSLQPNGTLRMWTSSGGGTLTDSGSDPYDTGAFTPGMVTRDVLLQLDRTFAPRGGSVAVSMATGADAVRLEIGGISAFGTAGVAHQLDRQHRAVPWSPGDARLAVVLGLDFLSLYGFQDGVFVGQGTLPRDDEDLGVWVATPKQLREMTWTPYERALVFCHVDWPRPRQLLLAEDGTLSLRTLALQNLPVLPAEVRSSARQQVAVRPEGLLVTAAAGAAPPPRQARPERTVAGATGLRSGVSYQTLFQWERHPEAASYDLMWDVKANYDRDQAAWLLARGPSVPSANLPSTGGAGSITGITSRDPQRVEIRPSGGRNDETEYVIAVRAVFAGRPTLPGSVDLFHSRAVPGAPTILSVVQVARGSADWLVRFSARAPAAVQTLELEYRYGTTGAWLSAGSFDWDDWADGFRFRTPLALPRRSPGP